MTTHLRQLIAFRGLLWNLALAEFKARHRQTALGMLWAVAQPIAMMTVTTVVFSLFVRISDETVPYALVAYVGLWSWLLFANSLTASVSSIVGSMSLVTKANFPREVIPFSKIVVTGFDFAVGLALLLVLMAFYGIPYSPSMLVIPGLFLVQGGMLLGLMLICSAAYVMHRDIGALLPLGLQLLMLLSPVLYPASVIPEPYQSWYLLNPLAALIESYRKACLYGTFPTFDGMIGPLIVSLTLLAMGYRYFKSVEKRFADVM